MMVHCNCRCCDRCLLLCKEPGVIMTAGISVSRQTHVPAVSACFVQAQALTAADLTLPQFIHSSRGYTATDLEGRVRR